MIVEEDQLQKALLELQRTLSEARLHIDYYQYGSARGLRTHWMLEHATELLTQSTARIQTWASGLAPDLYEIADSYLTSD